MLTPLTQADFSDYMQYVVWSIWILIVGFGLKYAKGIIAFVLDKLYELFIQNNPLDI